MSSLTPPQLIAFYRKNWDGTQSEFCERYQINKGNFSSFLNGNSPSPASCEAVRTWYQEKNRSPYKPPPKSNSCSPPSVSPSLVTPPKAQILLDNSAPSTGDQVLCHGEIYYYRSNGTSCYLYRTEKDLRDKNHCCSARSCNVQKIKKTGFSPSFPSSPETIFKAEPHCSRPAPPEWDRDPFAPIKRKRISQQIRNAIFGLTKGKCYLCKKELENGWHIEHIIPFSKDPRRDSPGNFLPACARCNLRKGSYTNFSSFTNF